MSAGSLEQERLKQQQLIEHIRSLLVRADERKREEPENYRKWNRVLDNLETALAEAKAKLSHCESVLMLQNERQWPKGADATPPAENPAPAACLVSSETEPISEDGAGNIQATEAAQNLLNTPLESVEKAPLEQVALAQRYLAWRQQSGNVNGTDRRLAGRVELAIQGRNAPLSKPPVTQTVEERRHQKALREIVAKIQRNRLNTLTILELELAVECYMVLSQRLDLDDTERRLREILLRGLQDAERVLSHLRQRVSTKA
jgi:hypothetical protein